MQADAVVTPKVDLGGLSRAELVDMAEAGKRFLRCRRQLLSDGKTIAAEIVEQSIEPFTHYPAGDVYDPSSHAQYYFHLHRPNEYGHFHTFLRAPGMPAGMRPLSLGEAPAAGAYAQGGDGLSHLVGIALDRRGEPGELFTTNRWVTAESWYKAADVAAMLPRFEIGHGRPSPVANQWITAVMGLFRPHIIDLLKARDARLEEHCSRSPAVPAFEDPALEITSRMAIYIDHHIADIEHALSAR